MGVLTGVVEADALPTASLVGLSDANTNKYSRLRGKKMRSKRLPVKLVLYGRPRRRSIMHSVKPHRSAISTGYFLLPVILIATAAFVGAQTPEPTPRLAFNDSRYIRYKAIRDEYANLYEEYTTPDADGAIRNNRRRADIRKRVGELRKAAEELHKQDDFMDRTRPGEFSKELTDRLSDLLGATSWSQDAGPQDDRKRKYKRVVGGVESRPYRTYIQKQDLFDRLQARLAQGGLTAAQKKAALDELQNVINSLTAAIGLLDKDRTAPEALISLLRQLKRDAETLKSQNRPAADLDRQAFILELERHKKEIIDAYREFEAKFGSRAIRQTYLAAFLKAGRDDWNGYVSSWSDSFWVSNVEGQTSIVLFRRPIEVLTASAHHLRNGRPFNATDVAYFRQRMELLRGRWASLTIVFNQLIQMAGEVNADRFLLSRSKTMPEEQFKARQEARRPRTAQLNAEIQNLTTEKAFAYTVGEAPPPKPPNPTRPPSIT